MSEVLQGVGPKDVDQAGDLVRRVGARHQAKSLIRLHDKAYPAALVAALSRPRHDGRSKTLDADEVAEQVKDAGMGKDVQVLDAAVRGRGEDAVVSLALTAKSGRVFKAVIPYDRFPDSNAAYEHAAATKGALITSPDDPAALRRQLEETQEELARARSGGDPAPEATVPAAPEDLAPVPESTPAADEKDAEIARLKAQLEDAQKVAEPPTPPADNPDPPAEPYPGYAEQSVGEVAESIVDADRDLLSAVEDAEKAGRNSKERTRSGVLDAIQARRDVLNDE